MNFSMLRILQLFLNWFHFPYDQTHQVWKFLISCRCFNLSHCPLGDNCNLFEQFIKKKKLNTVTSTCSVQNFSLKRSHAPLCSSRGNFDFQTGRRSQNVNKNPNKNPTAPHPAVTVHWLMRPHRLHLHHGGVELVSP